MAGKKGSRIVRYRNALTGRFAGASAALKSPARYIRQVMRRVRRK
jgi:hypothetical protein